MAAGPEDPHTTNLIWACKQRYHFRDHSHRCFWRGLWSSKWRRGPNCGWPKRACPRKRPPPSTNAEKMMRMMKRRIRSWWEDRHHRRWRLSCSESSSRFPIWTNPRSWEKIMTDLWACKISSSLEGKRIYFCTGIVKVSHDFYGTNRSKPVERYTEQNHNLRPTFGRPSARPFMYSSHAHVF